MIFDRLTALFQRRVLRTLSYSGRGLAFAFKNEEAFRLELLAMCCLVALALWLGETVMQRVLLIAPCVMVLIVELLNSAVEAVVDLTCSEQHPLAAAAKDMGSAAVLLSLLLVPLVWLAVMW